MASLQVPMRMSALSLAVSGINAVVLVPLHPNILNQPIGEAVRNTPAWMGLHLFAVLVCVLSVIGVAGIVAAHEGKLGRTGQTGLLLTLLGSAAAGAVASVEALAFPAVADTAPHLLDLNGPMFSWPFIGTGIIALFWLVGIGVTGAAAARAAMFPRGAGVLLAVGALGFIVLAGPFVPVANVAAGIVFGAAQLWWAWLLWRPNQGRLNDRVGTIKEAGGIPSP